MLSSTKVFEMKVSAQKILVRESKDSQLGLMCRAVVILCDEVTDLANQLSNKGFEMDAMRDRARQV